jgi:ferredoxin
MSGNPSRFEVSIETKDCILCAACSSIAPEIFEVKDDGAHVLRQPATQAEFDQADAAAAACPVAAIKIRSL